jgi:hypothetical protein
VRGVEPSAGLRSDDGRSMSVPVVTVGASPQVDHRSLDLLVHGLGLHTAQVQPEPHR